MALHPGATTISLNCWLLPNIGLFLVLVSYLVYRDVKHSLVLGGVWGWVQRPSDLGGVSGPPGPHRRSVGVLKISVFIDISDLGYTVYFRLKYNP